MVEAFRARVARVVRPYIPQMGEWEQEGHIPREFFRALGAAGVFRERWQHGAAPGLPLARVLTEELAVHNGGAALAVSLHSEVFVHVLHGYGDRHGDTLEQALDGIAIGCAAITEPGGGSDVAGMSTQAVRTTDGWHLTGTKRYTTNVGRATHALVVARTGAASNACTLFLVPLDRPGVRIAGFFTTLGVRSADTGGLELDVRLGIEDVVGRPGTGLLTLLKVLDFERIAAVSGLVAGARHALRLAAAHMRRRTQFGKRLYDHQALRHQLADAWSGVEASAALLDIACRPARGGQPTHHLVAAAKLVGSRNCAAAVDVALQVLGARGYTDAYPVERLYRDMRLTRIGGGTDEMMREIISASLDMADPEMNLLLDDLAMGEGPQEAQDQSDLSPSEPTMRK
ncbi:acyl-CoA/acyl-ACP dehydrogenase [Streptacidiphilus sp. P02-A3a]|nr:acyl-CoA dehydrogenase family protein [Streptacidiphilus sp. P02-A3a]QMU67189.1 acyl-CoA/acyl-ACP dehydrogenase [Streptacidiphilus sp. P02-A3a]